MKYGIFRDSEFLWDNEEQKLYRKLINTSGEFKELMCKPKKGNWGKGKPYIRFRINKKDYYLHRLIYYLYNPDFDIYDSSINNVIDHKDSNTLNNSIENLNVVSQKQNCQHRKNVKGFWIEKKKNRIHAYYRNKDGKQITKYFSIKKYGYDKALELAKQFREENTKDYYKG
jgi:hypothetical protein